VRILALHQGVYGQRILQNVARAAVPGWTVAGLAVPRALPLVIDEPEDFLPQSVPAAALVLAMTESPEAAQLVPALVRRAGARGVIMPVDSSAWLPPGLCGQLQEELARAGAAAVFPKTFCTLTETAAGYGPDAVPYRSDLVAEFAAYFGRPRLRIETDGERITRVAVGRGAPCGSTRLVAERLVGVPAAEATPRAGLFAHHYPCLASMAMEPNGETLMHISGHVVNDEVARCLGRSH